MDYFNDDKRDIALELSDAMAADKFAEEMDDIMMDLSDMNPDICPPDRRIFKGDREAWVYEHGNIAELVFVRID